MTDVTSEIPQDTGSTWLPFPSLSSYYELAHLLPFSLMKPTQCPFLNVACWGFQDLSSSSSSATLSLLSLFVPFYHPLPYWFVPLWKPSLCVPGVRFYLATSYQPPCFISPFLQSVRWLRENGASVFSSVPWEGLLRIQGWSVGRLRVAHSKWFGFRDLEDFWKRMSWERHGCSGHLGYHLCCFSCLQQLHLLISFLFRWHLDWRPWS